MGPSVPVEPDTSNTSCALAISAGGGRTAKVRTSAPNARTGESGKGLPGRPGLTRAIGGRSAQTSQHPCLSRRHWVRECCRARRLGVAR